MDVVSESSDGRALLLGEVTWADAAAARACAAELLAKAENFPERGDRDVFCAVWLKRRGRAKCFRSEILGMMAS
jgi:hypothetical protein